VGMTCGGKAVGVNDAEYSWHPLVSNRNVDNNHGKLESLSLASDGVKMNACRSGTVVTRMLFGSGRFEMFVAKRCYSKNISAHDADLMPMCERVWKIAKFVFLQSLFSKYKAFGVAVVLPRRCVDDDHAISRKASGTLACCCDVP